MSSYGKLEAEDDADDADVDFRGFSKLFSRLSVGIKFAFVKPNETRIIMFSICKLVKDSIF